MVTPPTSPPTSPTWSAALGFVAAVISAIVRIAPTAIPDDFARLDGTYCESAVEHKL
jgi:hypothetical protein